MSQNTFTPKYLYCQAAEHHRPFSRDSFPVPLRVEGRVGLGDWVKIPTEVISAPKTVTNYALTEPGVGLRGSNFVDTPNDVTASLCRHLSVNTGPRKLVIFRNYANIITRFLLCDSYKIFDDYNAIFVCE